MYANVQNNPYDVSVSVEIKLFVQTNHVSLTRLTELELLYVESQKKEIIVTDFIQTFFYSLSSSF